MIYKVKYALLALLLACMPALAQTPGASSNPTVQPVAYLNPNYEPPCAPATTTGTITLALGVACANPVISANGGSPDNWQFTLTGNGTLATTGPYKPGQVFTVKVTEGSGTPFTLTAPVGWSIGGLCTANSVPIAYCTAANLVPLSGVTNGKNIFTCQVIDTTPTIWCPAVSAGLTTASTGTPSILSSGLGNSCNTNPGASCTFTVNLTTGSELIVASSQCGDGICGNTTGPTISSITGTGVGTCSAVTGLNHVRAGNYTVDLQKCAVTATNNTVTVTVNYSSSGAFYNDVGGVDIANYHSDAGVGNVGAASSATPSIASNGATTSPALLLGFYYNGLSSSIAPFTPQNSWTLVGSLHDGGGNESPSAWITFTQTTAGAFTAAANIGASENWIFATAAFN